MNYETIIAEKDSGVLTLTLNRPERLNAWTYQMRDELVDAIQDANEDDDIVAMVVTGAGRGFCAGADIGDVFKAQADEQDKEAKNEANSTRRSHDWVDLVRNSKPMVCAINGAAIGVGLTQVLPMDYLIAADNAKLSVRFIKMGVVPELASSRFLFQRLSWGNASELMLSGKTIMADEALQVGLVDRVTTPDELLEVARTVAKGMGENPQSALRMVKQLITENSTEADLKLVQKREIQALNQCYESPEHKEAINAFLEKRNPDFKTARSSN